jgi:hypothetical protein
MGQIEAGAENAMLKLGDKVFLRGARTGEPGVVIRIQTPARVTVIWPSPPDYLGHYPDGELIPADGCKTWDGDGNCGTLISNITPI